MKTPVLILVMLVIGAFATAFTAYSVKVPNHHATCTGAKYCSACKNCKACKHCAKEGGSCGVCK